MNSDNPPVHNASHPDAEESEDAGDADAIQGKNGRNARGPGAEAEYEDPKSEIESSKVEKKPAGVAVGNQLDANANRDKEEVEVASQSKRASKEKKKAEGLALAPAIEPHDPGPREVRPAFAGEEKTEIVADPATRNYRATRLDEEEEEESEMEDASDSHAVAPGAVRMGENEDDVRIPNRLAKHRKNRRERQALADEEQTEIVVDPATTSFRATRVDEEDPQEELEDDSDSFVFPGAVRIGGNEDDDFTSAPDQAESLEVGLSTRAASSAALLLQAELAPDTAEEIARAVIEERERGLKERDQNTVLATAVEVDEVVDVDDVESKFWKLKIVLFVLFVIGTVTALAIVFTRERSNPADPPTMIATVPPTMIATVPPTMIATDPPTINRLSIIQDVIASSFEDDFPNSSFQEEALDWLVNLDPASLGVDTDSTMLLERYTAALFYFATQGDEWSSQNNWLNVLTVCAWSLLECNDQGFIARMRLEDNNLGGQIPSELAVLTNLEYLDLGTNALTGPIPSEFGLLTELTGLDLRSNALTGPIPSELGLLSKMTLLSLGGNALTGSIPSELGLLTELTFLLLDDNALTGSIPSELHQLTITRMVLWGNNFTNCEDFKSNHIHPSLVLCFDWSG